MGEGMTTTPPSVFWSRVESLKILDGFERWDDPPLGKDGAPLDRGYSTRFGPCHAVVRMYWYEYPDRWRQRIELGLRHEAVEAVLDEFFRLHPYETLESWRLTYSGFVASFDVEPGPTSLTGSDEVVNVVPCFEATIGRARRLAKESVEIGPLLDELSRVSVRPDRAAICLLLLNRRPEGERLLLEGIAQSKGDLRRGHEFLDWFRSMP
jgi:hypothetical protein